MKLRKLKPKRKKVPKGSRTRKGNIQSGIKLGDGSFHLVEHEKAGWFVAYWNGEKCQCRVIRAMVQKPERSIHTHPWYLPFVGTEVQAIEVSYYGKTFFISNQDGSGMQKITVGRGSPHSRHAQFEEVEVLEVINDRDEWRMVYDFEVSNEIAIESENYWRFRDPDHFNTIKAKRLELVAIYEAAQKEVKRIEELGKMSEEEMAKEVKRIMEADESKTGRK